MKRKWIVLALSTLLLLPFPMQVFGEEIDHLSLDMIEYQMLSKNPDILKNVSAYYQSISSSENNESQDTSKYDKVKDNKETFETSNDPKANAVNAAISDIYEQLLQTLAPKKTTTSSGSGNNEIKQAWNTEKSNYQIVWNAQKMFIAYHELQRSLGINNVKLTQVAYENRMTLLKKTVGLATEQDVLTAENKLAQQKKTIKSLQDQSNKQIKQFNLMLAQDSDSPLVIEAVPAADPDEITQIDVNTDYEKALTLSYDVKTVQLDGTQSENEIAQNNFEDSFYAVYQDLQNAVDEYQFVLKQAQYAQSDYEKAKKRLSLGLIKQSDYISADYAVNSVLANVQTTKDALYQAYLRYEWAKRGLIVN